MYIRTTVDFTVHPDAAAVIAKGKSKDEKLVRYQTNPLPNWGPAARAKTVMKRKSEDEDQGPDESKKQKAQATEEEALMNL